MPEETYAGDVEFLNLHTEIVELTADEKALVAVAPEYQGRVMTSSLAGGAGASFGWLNRPFIASGDEDPRFNNYGGEDRFWLGPEGGQFGLWFAEGQAFEMTNWKTPAGFGSGAFETASAEAARISMTKRFEVTNYSGTKFQCSVKRTISAIGREAAGVLLGTPVADGVAMVGFESDNRLTNAGQEAWDPAGGLLSIWTLGQFKPLPRGKIIIPFVPGDEQARGVKATTDYFGPIPPERIWIGDDHLLFSCDGKWRSKIGISPARARNVAGSYDPDAGLLTVVQFSLPDEADKLPYVNSLWEIQDQPYAGDVVNSYNDGEETPGAGQFGPFYEIESSSPAARLRPGESIRHIHRTFHFAGEFDELNALAKLILGVDLGAIG